MSRWKVLEGDWRIAQAKRHYFKTERTIPGQERGLVRVSRVHLDLMAPAQ